MTSVGVLTCDSSGRTSRLIAIHSAGYLSASSATALVVFEKFGVGVLRKAWINLDVVWALALVVTSAAALLVP